MRKALQYAGLRFRGHKSDTRNVGWWGKRYDQMIPQTATTRICDLFDTAMDLIFREARHSDLHDIAHLLSDDSLGASRDGLQHLESYAQALTAVQSQAGNSIIVATLNERIVGMLQLTLIPGLSRGGMLRAQIESVRVAAQQRGRGVGRVLFQHAIQQARCAGAGLVQLTTDKRRAGAIRFYESLGFNCSHEGMKLKL